MENIKKYYNDKNVLHWTFYRVFEAEESGVLEWKKMIKEKRGA